MGDQTRDRNDGRHRAMIWQRFGGPMPLINMLSEVLPRAGGVKAPAQRTVYQWAELDSIPDQYHDALFEAAARHGIALYPADFFAERWREGVQGTRVPPRPRGRAAVKETMKVALIQMNSQGDKPRNLEQARRLIEQAVAEERPDLVALPEMWTLLSEDSEEKQVAAEPVPGGEGYGLMQELAAKHGIVLHGGSLIERDGDRLFNTTVAFDRDGRELARYRKLHLFDIVTPDGKEYRESATFGRGARVVTYDVLGTRIGCSICYDLRFSELFVALAKDGAKVILVPSAFTLQTGKDHWEVLLRARAIETQTYVLAPAQWGRHAGGARATYGHSLIADPWGHVIAKAQDRVGYVAARLDLADVERVRARMPCADHRVL